MNLKKALTFFLIIITNGLIFAQNERKITGIVLDNETNLPIIGANVFIKNTSVGAVTNASGKFTYTLKSDNIAALTLQISYVGYEQKSVKVGKNSDFTILLKSETANLDDVVVTSSYGTKKRKEDLVGSVTNLKSSDLQVKQSVETFDKMLDGLAAGVLITGGSTIGSPVKINIRGQGSLTPLNNNVVGTSTQPLIIIDGVVMSEETGFDNELFDGSGNLTEQFKNPLAKISPEDIESITILKDAAAVGIYGADAANGVILITSKKSKSKKLDLNFSTQTGFSSPINQIKFLSGPQYFDIYKEYLMSQGQSAALANVNAGSSTIDTNWFQLTNRNGSFQRYNLSAGLGFKGWNFRSSFNVLYNEEPQLSNNFKRYGGNFNAGYSNKKWTAQLSVSPSIIKQNAPNTLASFPLKPNVAAFNADGSFAELGIIGFGNPIAVANQNLNYTETFGAVASLNVGYNITKNLKITTLFGMDYTDKNQNRYFSGANESGRANGTFIVNNPDGTQTTYPNWGRRLDSFRNSFRWNQSTQILYEKKIGIHSFDGLLGLELQREKTDNRRILGTGFVNPGPVNNAQDTDGNFLDNNYFSENSKRSFFTQANYNFDKRYFILANFRRDESSAFGGDVNAALNGGLGLAWNISNETFLKNTSWIDFLRFRASYGVTGNSRIGSFRALGLYFIDLEGEDGYNGNPFAYPSTAPNPKLSWERNYKFNLGLDFNISKFKFTLEYFRDNITDIISTRSIPLEIGFSNIQINGSDMINRGLELSVQANWFTSNVFSWSTNFNISTLENKITKLQGLGDQFSTSERARAQQVGSSTTAIWGVKFEGIDPATGRELFSNNGQIYDAATYVTLFNQNDWEIIGDSQPDFYGGFQNNFSFFKHFNLAIRASFRYGDEILIEDELESQYRVLVNRNLSINTLDRWQQQGDITNNPRVTPNNPTLPNSSKFLYDASHIKIQNINLSYQVPLQKYNIKAIHALNFSCDVSNVAYFYKEKSLRGKNGIQEYRFAYPEVRTLTFGCQANF